MATPTGGSAESSFVQLPSLPAKSPSPPKSKTKPIQPELKLPLIPATKTEKYLRLRYFDRHVLKRHKAHFRNALKTTDGIQKITKQLNERLSSLGKDDGSLSFERLAAFSDAFEQIIEQSGDYAPTLRKIKDAYHEELMSLLSEEYPSAKSIPESVAPLTPDPQLIALRKELHQLQIRFRVAAHRNKVLQDERAKEEELHKVMAELAQPLEPTPPEENQEMDGVDYIAQVEHLQQLSTNERIAIAKVEAERKSHVPLSVCHQLQQCIREVEIEIHKQQRRKEKLTREVDELSRKVETIFRSYGYSESASEILTKLGSVR